MSYIGLDIGGTNIKYGLIADDGQIICKGTIPTLTSLDDCVDSILHICEGLLAENLDSIRGIGIGCPGIINSSEGVVEYSCNLKWEDVPLAKIIEDKLGIPVRIGNDATVATLGETLYGAGKGYKDAIMLTLGTGVGGGIIIDKKMYDGNKGAGGELGHMVIRMDGKPCGCGMKGCLEAYASAPTFLRAVRKAMREHPESRMWDVCAGDIKNVGIFTPFNCIDTDAYAKEIVDKYVKYLGTGIINYCNIFRPEIVMLGGGVSNVGEPLISRLVAYCESLDYGYKHSPKVVIKLAELKNDAGIVGGRALFGE